MVFERTEEEQQELTQIIETMPAYLLLAEMKEVFGVGRVAELIGWAVIWGIAGVQSVKDLRLKLEAQGMSERAAYRAAADYKKFGDHLYSKYHRLYEVPELLRKIAQASTR